MNVGGGYDFNNPMQINRNGDTRRFFGGCFHGGIIIRNNRTVSIDRSFNGWGSSNRMRRDMALKSKYNPNEKPFSYYADLKMDESETNRSKLSKEINDKLRELRRNKN